MGLHPSEVIKGYELACTKALSELDGAFHPTSVVLRSLTDGHLPALTTSELPSPLTQETLARAVTPSIASKQYGSEDLLARLVAEAALLVMPENRKSFNVDNVRVVKIMGGSLAGSKVVQGMVFGRGPEGA